MSDAAPLEGIRVLEIGVMIAVPAATHILASYGAEVIKVEDHTVGDTLRFFGSNKGGMSGWFVNANWGKRSIAIDIKSNAGKEVLTRLIQSADVLVEGFRTGVMDRLGFGYEDVRKLNEQIVYCSSSGFGASGPYAKLPAYDPLIQALTGWAGFRLMMASQRWSVRWLLTKWGPTPMRKLSWRLSSSENVKVWDHMLR